MFTEAGKANRAVKYNIKLLKLSLYNMKYYMDLEVGEKIDTA